jgi:hypothetical protein
MLIYVLRWRPSWISGLGKCSNAFFSETTNMIKAKLYMNVHWMFFYKFKAFYPRVKFKMAATARFSLTLDPMGKCFKTLLLWNHLDNWNQTAQEWSLEGPLQSFCFFMYSLTLIICVVSEKKAFQHFPIGSNVNLCSSVAAILDFRSALKKQKLCRGRLKPNCTWMFIGCSSTNLRFSVPIWNSKWRLRQELVLHWVPWGKSV